MSGLPTIQPRSHVGQIDHSRIGFCQSDAETNGSFSFGYHADQQARDAISREIPRLVSLTR
jgi:hypothetical protein